MSDYYIGLMSGTSVDAIDAVLMDFSVSNTHIIASHSHAITQTLRNEINTLILKKRFPKDFQEADQQFAQASSDAVKALLERSPINDNEIIAIGSHGQTVFHDPKGIPPVSLQIGDPQFIANHTGIPTIGNFRQADIDAGGQGAPLACAYHAKVLRDENEERVVLNLGGIANITKLPQNVRDPILGFDTGPANTLMDAWTQKHLNKAFDQDGTWASSGNLNARLLEQMLSEQFFTYPPPKSTGREHFNLEWLQHYLDSLPERLTAEDIQATLLALTTYTIADSIDAWCPETKKVLLCGGGSSNKKLVGQLKKLLEKISIEQTENYGVPSKFMESMAFAWLAKQYIEGKPGNIPSVTGADKSVQLGELFQPNKLQS